uniref:Putative Snf7 domain-containing protein n=1 Tax=uncultured organism TaxID=155900 RepID=A0A0F6PZR1_9ZZZZ|nr:putative Snf7 domain-containing protein [uncultured organism]
MSNFGQDWQRPPTQGVSEKLQGLVKKEKPLKPRVESTIRGLNRPISKLDSTSKQLSKKEQKLFNKIVQAKQNGNIKAAKVLATELVQMRKTGSMIGNMKLSVEKTQLRLSTVNAVGDVIVSMQPAVSTMKAVVPAMNKIMPQASAELESMGNLLGDMMPGSIGSDNSFADSEMSSQETDSILQEAAAIAETQIGDKFPTVPNDSVNVRTFVDSLTGS